MFERLMYISRAREGITLDEVYHIVRSSYNRNSAHGVTGALLYHGGWFLQVLEGDSYDVSERFNAIEVDHRHCDVKVVQRLLVLERLFPDDWMALSHPEDFRHLDGRIGRAWSLFDSRRTTPTLAWQLLCTLDPDSLLELIVACTQTSPALSMNV